MDDGSTGGSNEESDRMTVRPVRIPDLSDKKTRGEKIAMLTAYDATMARLLDRAGLMRCSSAIPWGP